jgi:hypothetical protein
MRAGSNAVPKAMQVSNSRPCGQVLGFIIKESV